MKPASPLRLADAATRIRDAIVPIVDVERIPLAASLGRVIARDVVAADDVPAHDNAAMDGYALRSGAHRDGFRVIGEARAGRPFTGAVGVDECVRILTGAVMPADCDAVVPQEQAIREGDVVTVARVVVPGQHRRLAGEDSRRGSIVLARGRRMTAADLGLAASAGAGALEVWRRPRVAVFSTGDELREVDASLARGDVRDANRYTLIGLLDRLGVDVIDLGIVADDPAALAATLSKACHDDVRADAVITSGGVSAGDADHVRDVVRQVGSVDFWTLAIKPGRPMAFGTIDAHGRRALLFGLPGNPVAVLVVFYALVRDALDAMAGATPTPIATIDAICDEAIGKLAGRTEFIRAVIVRQADGWHARSTGPQGSGILRSMSDANALIVLDHDRGAVTAGERVVAWPFHGLL